MNDTSESKSPLAPRLLAKMSWQLCAVAIGIITFTRGLSIKVPAESFALLLICGGFLLGVVMLATIPKYGAQGILKPALLGIALNGILLSIAIPNFINARNEAIRRNEALIKTPISSLNWQEYKIAGLQFLSPVGLETFNATAKESNKNIETYMGQLVPPGLTVILHRRTLSADDEYTLESFSSEVVDLMKQKWPDNFQSSIRDRVIDGVSSRQISAQFQKNIPIINDSVLIIKKQPFIWEIQVLVPKESPNGDETAEKIFNSIKLLPPAD
jgi:hypothetical protein